MFNKVEMGYECDGITHPLRSNICLLKRCLSIIEWYLTQVNSDKNIVNFVFTRFTNSLQSEILTIFNTRGADTGKQELFLYFTRLKL